MKKNNMGDWVEAILSSIGLGKMYRKNRRIKRIERRLGEVDFGGHLLQNELGFSDGEGNDYTPSPDYLIELCNKRISESDVIMDLGCGKGYAMYLMSQFPFRSIYGIELSESLVKIAKDNIRIFDQNNRCQIWNIDATKLREDAEVWDRLKECNYIYIYNSFPKGIIEIVVNELVELCKDINRIVTVWYVSPSPECLEVFDKNLNFSLVKRYFDKDQSGGVYEFSNKMI